MSTWTHKCSIKVSSLLRSSIWFLIYSQEHKLKNNASNILILYPVIISTNERYHFRCKQIVILPPHYPWKGEVSTSKRTRTCGLLYTREIRIQNNCLSQSWQDIPNAFWLLYLFFTTSLKLWLAKSISSGCNLEIIQNIL